MSFVSSEMVRPEDEEVLVWDSVKEELFLYVPDPNGPRVAFKGSKWQFAKRLKPEYKYFISLIYIKVTLMT